MQIPLAAPDRTLRTGYCHEARLAVEVDGAVHTWPDQLRSDRRRDEWLAGQGIRVLRIPAKYVLDNLDGAFELIRAALKPNT